MEVVKRYFHAFVHAIASFLDEAYFRGRLACGVLFGRVPRKVDRREWNREVECPVLIDVRDWVNDRLIFSVLVWPPLESEADDAIYSSIERVSEIKQAITRGAAEIMWSTFMELDYLTWDSSREVWVDSSDCNYDGARFKEYSQGREENG